MPLATAVEQRYAAAARRSENALCCPVDYDRRYLEVIPQEVIERDYGCGDPSRWVREGETVLDLGSGTGKICFIASQVVGPKGRVIGIDMTDEMLEVARRNAPIVAERIGYANVEFRKGRIQDLALNLELLDRRLRSEPLNGADAWLQAERLTTELREDHPLVGDNSIDVVVSNCVLNLVDPASKPRLFDEMAEASLAEVETKLRDLQIFRDALAKNLGKWRTAGTRKNRAAEFCALIESSGDIGSASH